MDVHAILEILQAFGQDFHPYRNLEAMYGNVVVVYKVFWGGQKKCCLAWIVIYVHFAQHCTML